MSTQRNTTDGVLTEQTPDVHDWDREQFLEAFIEVVNTIEPDHPYYRDERWGGDPPSVWPVDPDDVDFRVNRGNKWASCGPRYMPTTVRFGLNASRVREMAPAKVLAIFVHEATHITQGRQSEGSIHNKAFWREYAFLALETRDALQDGDLSVWPSHDPFVDEFLARVVQDARPVVIDQREWSQDEARAQVAEWLGVEDCRFAPE